MDRSKLLGKRLGRWFTVALSGMALSWAYPGRDWGMLAWFLLIPLMAVLWTAADGSKKLRGFGYGYLFGVAFFLCNLSWLSTVSGLGVVILGGYLALYPALWGMVLSRWMNPWGRDGRARQGRVVFRSLGYAFAHGSLWAGLECLRGWVFTGFGWNGLGVAMHNQPVLSQCADLFGVAGLSGWMVFSQSMLLQVAARAITEAKQARLRAHPDFVIAALLSACLWIYGYARLSSENNKEFLPLRVCLVQLNVPQVAARQLWTPEEIHLGYEEEVEKAMQAVDQRNREALDKATQTRSEADVFYPDWLVLPEVALTGRLMSAATGEYAMWRENEMTIDSFRQHGEFDILLGMGELEALVDGELLSIAESPKAWNSLVVLPRSSPLQRFQKRHLVMFGEYIPLMEQMPWLKRIYEQQAGTTFDGAFDAGTSVEPIPLKVRGQQISIIPSICFEDTVPREAGLFVRNESQVIVNVTNDGWFAQSAAAAQHFANAKFRAIELRRPMIRCANTGVSGVISTTGHAQTLTDPNGSHFTRGHLLATAKIPINPTATLYQKCGDGPVYLAALLTLIVCGVVNARSPSVRTPEEKVAH